MNGAFRCSLMLLAAAELAVAQEQPVSHPSPAEDAISTARRDLDLIKAARQPGAPPKDGLPRIGVPELQVPPSDPLPLPTKKRVSDGKEAKSKNWLVDAMQKRPDDKRGDRASGRGGHQNQAGDHDSDLRDERVESARDEERASRDARETRSDGETSERKEQALENPLLRYSAGWMTAQDYALMRPVLESIRSDGAAPSAGFGSGIIPAGFGGNDVRADAPAVFGGAKPFAIGTPQENPYLQMLAIEPAGALASSPAPPPIRNSAPAPAALPAAPAITSSAPVSKIPDFVRPVNDEKYFKQLKRF